LATLRLPDERLAVRAAAFLAQKALRPSDSILQGAPSPAAAKGCYRFLENPRVNARALWDAIHDRTAQGLGGLPYAVSVQDTTALMFAGLKATTGLGTADQPREEALWMHSALVLRPDGHPLGLLHNHVWARPVADFGQGHARKSRPFEDKESFAWVRGIRRTAKLRDVWSPTTRLVHVFDSAGDVHEVLAEVVASRDDAVIRSGRDRCVEGEPGHLRAALAAAPLLHRHRIEVPRRQGQRRRTATVELRTASVTIAPSPAYRGREPVRVNAVWVHEPEPPEGVEGLDWLLLTTLPVGTVAQALRVVELYTLRSTWCSRADAGSRAPSSRPPAASRHCWRCCVRWRCGSSSSPTWRGSSPTPRARCCSTTTNGGCCGHTSIVGLLATRRTRRPCATRCC